MTKEGYVVNVPSNQYLPSFPEPEFNPDASNDDPSRLKPETPRPQPQPRPTQAPRPQPTPRPSIEPSYSPAATTPQPTYAPAPPQQTYTPAPPQQTYRPAQPQPGPRPTQPPVRVVPATQRPYQPSANNPQPSVVFQDQAVQIVPSACAAAMNCTLIEYCDAIGVMRKEPVQLTEFQKNYRVPMTDCMIMPSRELGKCCRDPDYTDPWPIGSLGLYNADELNAVFDSGAYKPDRQKASASKQVNVRVQPNQAFATTNQVVTRVAAPVVQQRLASQPRPYREIASKPTNIQQAQPIQPLQSNQPSCGVRNFVSCQFFSTNLTSVNPCSRFRGQKLFPWCLKALPTN